MTPGLAGRSSERPASAMRRAIGSARRMVAALPCRRRRRRRCSPCGLRALRAPGHETQAFRRRATPSRFQTAVLSVPLELRDGRELLPLDILPRSAAGGASDPARFPSGSNGSTFPGRSFPDAGVSGASLRDRAACRASSRAACQPCSLRCAWLAAWLRIAALRAASLAQSWPQGPEPTGLDRPDVNAAGSAQSRTQATASNLIALSPTRRLECRQP